MQYKIPLQIENEDVIVAGLSLRQLFIMMIWFGMAYGIFKYAEARAGGNIGLVLAIPLVIIGITIALFRVAEMTFLPPLLNFFRLSLNARSRVWSQGTDGFSDADIGYSLGETSKIKEDSNQSLDSFMKDREEATDKILKL